MSFTSHNVLKYTDCIWTSDSGSVSVPCNKDGGSVQFSRGGVDTSDPVIDIQDRMQLPTGKSVVAELVLKVLDSPESYKVFNDFMNGQVGSIYMPAEFRDRPLDGVVFEINMINARIKNPGSIKFKCDGTSDVELTIICSKKDMTTTESFEI